MLKGDSIPNIKTILRIALGKPTRKGKALGCRTAFLWATLLTDQLLASIRTEDRNEFDNIMEGTDWRGRNRRFTNTEADEQLRWVRRRYPQIAQALDLGSDILELIDHHSFYREFGFASHDEWYLALDDESYLVGLIKELQ